jgi:Zn-finger nucleic acid-binding protein
VSYRETAPTCPGCGEALDPKQVGEAVIDVCPACGGIWVDWFDGDLVVMVRGAPGVKGAPPARAPDSPSCPRCHRPLDAERYMESSAQILRCADCAGAFVPHGSARAIAGYDPERKGPPPATDALSRLSAVLQHWFGWEEKDPS